MISTSVGYMGGTKSKPTYRSMGDHSEAIAIVYDPAKISYDQLLDVFFGSHDATSKPWSRQYRSAVFYADDSEKGAVAAAIERWEKKKGRAITTDVESAGHYTLAEDYHQKYTLRSHKEVMAQMVDRYPDGSWVHSTAAARLNAVLSGYELPEDVALLGLHGPARKKIEGIVER